MNSSSKSHRLLVWTPAQAVALVFALVFGVLALVLFSPQEPWWWVLAGLGATFSAYLFFTIIDDVFTELGTLYLTATKALDAALTKAAKAIYAWLCATIWAPFARGTQE